MKKQKKVGKSINYELNIEYYSKERKNNKKLIRIVRF
jgi:hypothetical protein